ncbi:unnamed protein product [Caenorhabditis auriculariae]|uniref:General transcription factor IIF subunit 2 n=1 Tax=Caenorhabditis auriculariae TaxID=2777116 RepID=A0A8S1GSY5_9PELO|nr:unnamed protein product [Caenorhabditis auriculariae]
MSEDGASEGSSQPSNKDIDDLAQYLKDGWTVGYDVDYNGCGNTEIVFEAIPSHAAEDSDSEQSSSESSFTSSENTEGRNKHATYHQLGDQVEESGDIEEKEEPNVKRKLLEKSIVKACKDMNEAMLKHTRCKEWALQRAEGRKDLKSKVVLSISEDIVPKPRPPPVQRGKGYWRRERRQKYFSEKEKMEKVAKAMQGMTLPPPPGWENMSDEKFLDAVQEMSRKRHGNDVETDMAKRGLWLVKVPRYLSELWEANKGANVGKLVIVNDVVKFQSGQGLAQPKKTEDTPGPSSAKAPPAKIDIPDEYSFILHDIMNQTMAVLTEDKTGLKEDAAIRTGRLAIEGRIVKKAECRPPATTSYMRMKLQHIVKSTQPKKQVVQIEKAAVKYKPVSAHAEDMVRIKQKKEGAKTYRADRDLLRQAIFNAFEKHQYYRLQDLQQLTQQPASYVKELLQEIAVYNTSPPHKSMWELKPEYRNYSINPSSSNP